MRIRLYCKFLLVVVFAIDCSARTVSVSSCQTLGAALDRAMPGDAITVRNNRYSCGDKFSISRSGTPQDRVVIKAEHPGRAIFANRTELELIGNFITVQGFTFEESAVKIRGDHNRVTGNRFIDKFDFEAETGKLTPPMRAHRDLDASFQQYIADATGGGVATYTLHIPTAGTYAVWMRAQSPNGQANAFFVSIAGDEHVFQIPPTRAEGYIWRLERAVALDAGAVEFRVRTHAPGARLDQLMITPNLTFNPNASIMRYEAEDGTLTPPMQVQLDTDASDGNFISSPDGDGSATYSIPIPTDGIYAIWMRLQSKGDTANTCHISIAGEEDVFHAYPAISDGYVWRKTKDVRLEAGKIVELRVRIRKAGIRLDQIMLTDDLTFSPHKRLRGAIHVIGGNHNDIGFNEIGPWNTYGIRILSEGRRNHIHHNYLHDFVGKKRNGNEGIQLGEDGKAAADEAENRVEYNLLERVEIDSELISVKSSANAIQFNTFRDSDATVGTRQGHNSKFIANTIQRVRFVRAHGANHQFIGNCISGSDLMLEAGDEPVNAKETASGTGCAVNGGHPPAENTIVAGNRLSDRAKIRVGRRHYGARAATTWVLEAEEGKLSRPMRVQRDPEASRAHYIVDPDGGGQVTHTMCIPDASKTYDVWMRVRAMGGGTNSFDVSVGGTPGIFHIFPATSNGYIWHKVREGLSLEAGKVELQIRTREAGSRLDRIIVTDNRTLDPYDPETSILNVEAEDGNLTPSLQAQPDRAASGAFYVVNQSSQGAATYTHTVSASDVGIHAVWLRVPSLGDDADAFHVTVDGAEDVFHISSAVTGAYIWRQARDVHLDAGEVKLRIQTHAIGTRLDRIIMTPDLTFDPNIHLYPAKRSMIDHHRASQVILLDHEDTDLDFDFTADIPDCIEQTQKDVGPHAVGSPLIQ